MSVLQFSKEWIARSFRRSIGLGDLIGSLAGNTVTAWAQFDTSRASELADIGWQIPLFGFAGAIAFRFLAAPFDMWNEQKTRADRAEEQIKTSGGQRKLNERQKQILRKAAAELPAQDGSAFDIGFETASFESKSYAVQIATALNSGGWTVACHSAFFSPGVTEIKKGISFYVPLTPPGDLAIVTDGIELALGDAGIAFERVAGEGSRARIFVHYHDDTPA